MSTKKSFYEKLVMVAYSYFILLSATWFLGSLFIGGFFNLWASAAVLVFATQAYFKKKLTNLLIGILAFGVSIYSLLEFIFSGSKSGYDGFMNTMIAISVVSLIMSGILIFSYTKLSFKDQ